MIVHHGSEPNFQQYLMVDTVVNDMVYYCGPSEDGECGPGNTIDYSSFSPFNSSDYFHPYCKIDYNNKTSILDVRLRCRGL